MDRMKWISFLPVMISLLTIEDACGSCGLMDPPCPPPFPDFMALFAETLKNIPELLDNRTSLSTECPESINWTEFNWNLEYGSPVPLDPVCSHSTTPYPTAANQSNPFGVSSTPFGILLPTTPSGSPSFVSTTRGSTVPGPIQGGIKDSGETPNIGLPVGIAIGAAVLLLIVILVAVCIRRHKVAQKKEEIYRRFQSTTSHDVLVTSLDIPDTPQVHPTVIILRDSTFQESSTDATLRRTDSVDIVVIEKKIPDEIEAGPGGIGGCDNKAFEAALDDLEEDPGYAGSEACQENWENEWNNKFEEALMESNDDLPTDAEDTDCKRETNSDSHKEKLASRVSSNSSKSLSSNTKPTPSPFSSPSTRKSKVLEFRMPSPTRSAAFSTDYSSMTKPPTSRFSRPSATNWPTSGFDLTSSSSKPPLEKRSPSLTPSLTPSSDGPPAYSSPAVKPNEPPPFRQLKPGRSFEEPTPPETPMTPSGLPTYTEVMAVMDAQSSSPPEPTASKKEPRPPPPTKQLNSTKATTTSSPSNPLKSVESSVEGNPNPWKMQAKGNGKTNSEPDKPANTAVVRPWTGSKGQASDGRESAAVAAATPAAARPDAASASEATPGESVGDYSFRPVRSLLSQFETLDRKNP